MSDLNEGQNEKKPAPVGPAPISVSEADVSGESQTGKVILSACGTYISADRRIQDKTLIEDKVVVRLNATASTPRMSRYVSLAQGDPRLALRLHAWNAAVAASLLPTLHITEVAIRNFALQRIKGFYGLEWYKSEKLIRKIGGEGSQMAATLAQAVQNEVDAQRTGNLSNYITSELTFGFWVNVFTAKFTRELWNRPFHIYSSSMPREITLTQLHAGVDEVRQLRNSIAHHKNVICKPVQDHFSRVIEVLSWFCKPSSEFANGTASFPLIWACSPIDPALLMTAVPSDAKDEQPHMVES